MTADHQRKRVLSYPVAARRCQFRFERGHFFGARIAPRMGLETLRHPDHPVAGTGLALHGRHFDRRCRDQ